MNIKAEIKHIFQNKEPLKATADITLDDAVVIHDVWLLEKDKRTYITMPYKTWKNKAGEKRGRDVVHPITSSARQQMQDAVVKAYERALQEHERQEEGREKNAS